jgi:hypothetical protein
MCLYKDVTWQRIIVAFEEVKAFDLAEVALDIANISLENSEEQIHISISGSKSISTQRQ